LRQNETDRKPTKNERVAEIEMEAELYKLHIDLKHQILYNIHYPYAWDEVEMKYPVRPKTTRITARFDEEVVKFYRRGGEGYQARMNSVLRFYMFARISRYIEGSKDRDKFNQLI